MTLPAFVSRAVRHDAIRRGHPPRPSAAAIRRGAAPAADDDAELTAAVAHEQETAAVADAETADGR